MTGLVFLAPEGFAALLLLPLLVLLDLFSRRRVDVTVGSLHLLRKLANAPDAPREDARRRRFPFRPPLLFRLAAAALAATLLARPALVSAEGEGRRYVALLDLTASLGAIDRGRSRFDAVREDLANWLSSLSSRDRVLLLAAPSGEPIGEEGAPATVLARLPARAGQLSDDWPRALGAARAAAARADAPPDPILVFTDHAPEGAAPAHLVSRGGPVANAGIVSVAFPDGAAGDPFVVIGASVSGRVRLFADEAMRAEIDVAKGALASVTIAGGSAARSIRVELRGDALAADDVAPLAPAGRGEVAVAFTGRPADPATRRALSLLPGVRIVSATETPDLEIAFGAAPSLGARQSVAVDPPGGGEDLPGIGRVAAAASPVRALRDGDARLPGVATLARIGVRAAKAIEPEPGARALILASLGAEGEAPIAVLSSRVLAIGFDPAATEWPETPAFPAFWAAFVDARFGAGGGSERVVATGTPREVAAAGPGAARLVSPSEARVEAVDGAYRFTPVAVGEYRLETPDGRVESVGAAVLSAGETACVGEDRELGPVGGDGAMKAGPDERPMRIALALLAAAAMVAAAAADRRVG